MKMQDIPFKPRFSPEKYEEAKNWLKTRRHNFAGTANYCIYSDSQGPSEYLIQQCHRAISTTFARDRCLVATEIGIFRATDNNKSWQSVYRPFLQWLLRESPYRYFILNRDDFDFCFNYGLIVSADVYTPILQNIMIISRHFYECRAEVFKKFNHFIESGIHPSIAYQCTFNTTFSLKDLKPYETQLLQVYAGHRAQGTPCLDSLTNMVEEEIGPILTKRLAKRETYRTDSNYTGGTLIFSSLNALKGAYDFIQPTYITNSLFDNDLFRRSLSAYRKKTTQNEFYRPPNPFTGPPAPTRPGAKQMTYKEFWEVGVPFIQRVVVEKRREKVSD